MLGFVLASLLTLTPFPTMAASPADSVEFRPARHQWEHRLLFVFAPTEQDTALARQEKAFEGRDAGFKERDLRLLTVVGAGDGTYRDRPGDTPQPLTRDAAQRLRERFDVSPETFRVVLVGKDGTEKRREAEPVSARFVFDAIDAMPMRQRELREENGG